MTFQRIADDTVQGSVAGLIATVPMTLSMKILHRLLPLHERHPLPPRWITMRALKMLGRSPPRVPFARKALTLAAHFSYGAAAGVVYRYANRRALHPGSGSGIAYGLAVWAGSYLGILPAIGLLAPPKRHSLRRNALMIASHVVWGWALGEVTRRMEGLPRAPRRIASWDGSRAPLPQSHGRP
ncbi:DUF1440 domain-containing protein [Pendulispora brunnea]|uniref:DUF1440 domain-containing protein n=1 Tax=Pendulispora brunnea TaxID=2905690 RepID=A0ABZ2KB91_9BACT